MYGILLSRIWLPFHHMDSCTCTSLHLRLQLPSFTALTTPTHHTIALITQLSPITHLPWLSRHTCTSFTHPHISSTLPCTHCEVLFLPCRHFWALFPCWISCCRPGLFPRLWENSACLIWPCLPCWSVLLSVCRLPWSLAWTLFLILSCLRGIWHLGLTYACKTCLKT